MRASAERRLRRNTAARFNEAPSAPVIAGRAPANDLDAEAAVLSAILLSRDALDKVLETLRPEHFYSDANGRIFEAAQELALKGAPVDIQTIASWLKDRDLLLRIGGRAYLAQLTDATPSVAHVADHARVVNEKWRIRCLAETGHAIVAGCYGDYGDAQAYIDQAEQAIYALARTEQKTTTVRLGAAIKVSMEKVAAAADRGERITGTPTGYEKLDAKTAGLHDGDLMIVAARPGMGKTSFVLNLAVNVASPRPDPRSKDLPNDHPRKLWIPGDGVFVASLEMPVDQLANRMQCSEARVDLGRMRQGLLQPDDWRRLTEASAFLDSLPIWLDHTPGLRLLALRAKVRRVQAEYNREEIRDVNGNVTQAARRIGLVVVDYLQLMAGDGDNREQEISGLSRGLKQLAGELGVPVIALSQLNRSVETRSTKDKRPQLSDLRESGAIEQDADTIIFIYRDEYYNPETTNANGIAELIISKQRNGPTGKVLTRFSASCTRFDNLAAGDYPEMEYE